jgi:HSP20 family protein
MRETPNEVSRLRISVAGRDNDMDVFFDAFFGANRPGMMHADRGWHPPADLYETEEGLVVRMDIAGIDPKDVQVVLDQTSLRISGVRHEPVAQQQRQYHKMEVPYGPFERVFRLPCPVCAEKAKAEYREGFLTITLEKRGKPTTRKRTITIR